MNTWFLCPSNIQHGRTVETASSDKSFLRDAGFIHDYGRSPYSDYDQNGDIYFPMSFRSSQYHPKERVIGIEINGNFKAYPFVGVSQKKSALKDLLVGQQIILEFNLET